MSTDIGTTASDLVLDPRGPWTQRAMCGAVVTYAGSPQFISKLYEQLRFRGIDRVTLRNLLRNQHLPFGLLIETSTAIYAVTDHVRSFPIFFSQYGDKFFIGNSARSVRAKSNVETVSQSAVGEYLLSGYVHRNRTLYKGLACLLPGQILCFDKTSQILSVEEYFRYLPSGDSRQTQKQLTRLFGDTLDEIFSELVEDNHGRPIWLPLSGGLDSRLVLCKLLEHGAKQITTFTYGNRGNHEMAMAKNISSLLNVRWCGLPATPKHAQALYASSIRTDYAEYADGLHMTPVYLDFEALVHLHSARQIPNEALIINGYSGDFLFGGHIPELLAFSPSIALMIDQFIKKNASNISTPTLAEVQERIRSRLLTQVPDHLQNHSEATAIASLYEHLDWSERQTKAVVNGQRLYEFFGYEWQLPLWDRRLMDVWHSMPLHLKLNQMLHLQYLRDYNYKSAFSVLRSVNQIWPTQFRWIPTVGSMIGLTYGPKQKADFYERMFFRSYFNYQLSLFGRSSYRRWYRSLKRPRVIPLASLNRLHELGIDASEFLT